MFGSCVFYFIAVSSKRLQVFRNRVEALNGRVVRSGTDVSITHVVVDETLADNLALCTRTIVKECGELVGGVDYLSASWLCECLKIKKLAPCEEHRLQCLQKKRKLSDSEPGESSCITDDLPAVVRSPEHASCENTQTYLCSKPSPKNKAGLNEKIVGELQKLADTYRATNDTWRVYSYEKAISAISKYDKQINTYQDALAIPGVGEKLALKIMEVVESGAVRKVAEVCGSEEARTLELFCGVWGAGPATAEAWYRRGHRTLEQVRQSDGVTQQQLVGLRLYDDFNQRIPRKEVEEIGEVVNTAALAVHSALRTQLVGSYRRGKASSGDVDVMIVNPGPLNSSAVLQKMLTLLKEKGVITDDLTIVRESKQQRKWLGVARLREDLPHRRLDLFIVPASEHACALLHFTESALFNRSIRLLAGRKGMCLTEHGLYTGTVRRGTEVVHEGHLIPTESEEDIFKLLSLEYRPPEERDH